MSREHLLRVDGADLTTPPRPGFIAADMPTARDSSPSRPATGIRWSPRSVAPWRPAPTAICGPISSPTCSGVGFRPVTRARSQLETVIDRGRYAELFGNDADSDQVGADRHSGIHPLSHR